MRRSISALIALVVIQIVMTIAGPAHADDATCLEWSTDASNARVCTHWSTSSAVEIDATAENSDADGHDPVQDVSSDDGTFSVDRWAPTCTENSPIGVAVLCPGALSCAEGPDYVRYWHWVLTYQRPGDVLVSTDLVGSECRSSPPAGGPAVVTAGMVAAEMARLPIPPAVVAVQPVPTTLVNFNTGFYVDVEPAVFTVTLLGQLVAVRVTPVSFVYDFGDGHTLGPTTDRSAAYPDATVTHAYERPGAAAASVAVTYEGEFSVAGGPWLAVPGTVTIAGTPVDLRVREARAQLVAG